MDSFSIGLLSFSLSCFSIIMNIRYIKGSSVTLLLIHLQSTLMPMKLQEYYSYASSCPLRKKIQKDMKFYSSYIYEEYDIH